MSTYEDTSQEFREQIDATRRQLGATVEQLAAKTDVKARVQDRVEDLKDEVHDCVGDLRDEVKRALRRRPVLAAAIVGTGVVLLVGWTLSRHT